MSTSANYSQNVCVCMASTEQLGRECVGGETVCFIMSSHVHSERVARYGCECVCVCGCVYERIKQSEQKRKTFIVQY